MLLFKCKMKSNALFFLYLLYCFLHLSLFVITITAIINMVICIIKKITGGKEAIMLGDFSLYP